MARPVKHYGRWRIRWIDADGRRQSEVYDKYRDAELALQRHEVEAEEIRRGLRLRPVGSHTFKELADYWLEHRASRKRSQKDDASIIRKHLVPTFGTLRSLSTKMRQSSAAFTVAPPRSSLARRRRLAPATPASVPRAC